MEGKICPIMSRVVKYELHDKELLDIPCVEEQCALWVKQHIDSQGRKQGGGYCGLIR